MPDASPLLGTWKVISTQHKNIATGEIGEIPGLGYDPIGFISYTADGRVYTMTVNRNRPPPSGTPATSEEKQRLFDTMSAYGGTYTVYEDRVVHHVDIAWNQT